MILASDTATATELRYHQIEILARLNRELKSTVTELKVQLTPAKKTASERPEKLTINSSNRQLLEQTADNLEDDELAGVLRRLSALDR